MKKIRFIILCLLVLFCAYGTHAQAVIFQDGLTKVSDTKVEGDYALVGMFVGSGGNHGSYVGAASLKTLTTTAKCSATLPARDSIADFKFWIKAADGDATTLQIRRQINGGAWETIHTLVESSTSYVEKTIAVNTAAKNVRLQLYVEKTTLQAGYYFDDFLITKCANCVFKEASFASIFTPNMVLQRGKEVTVFGTASDSLPLTLEIQGQTLAATSSNGKFEFTVEPLAAGGPHSMRLQWDGGFKQIDNIYVGDVWLAGGQSNMDFAMRKVENYETVEKPAANYPMVKYYSVPKDYYEGHNKPSGNWVSCTPDQISEAFAVAYYAVREIYLDQQVPIGIIQCGLGGTSAESWMSRESLLADSRISKELTDYDNLVNAYKPGEYEELLAKYNSGQITTEPMGPKNFRRPAGMYYTMFQKILPFTVKGVMFYQGETNAKRGYGYRILLPALIKLWRDDLKQGDIPFLFVQLPKFVTSTNWAEIRESQYLTTKLVGNTGMSMAFDQGNPNDIHPTRKDTVGMRLAKVALAKVYGKNIPYSGPEYKRMNVRDGEIVLYFDHINGGLVSRGSTLKGFTICGSNEQFVAATATIQGDSIVVSSPSVGSPKHVRYGWFSSGDMTLYSKANLPGLPFRTDNFKLTTEDAQSGGNSEEAHLSSIKVNGSSIAAFNANAFSYHVSLPPSTTVIPVVSATAVDNGAIVGVAQAVSLTGTEQQRTAVITVTAEDLWTVLEYKVIFDLNGTSSCKACLQGITINSEPLQTFHVDTFSYSVLLNAATTQVPVVSAIADDVSDDVQITQARSLTASLWERTALVTVTSQDLQSERQYAITFNLDTPQGVEKFDMKRFNTRTENKTLLLDAQGFLSVYSASGISVFNGKISGHTMVKLPMPGVYFIVLKEGSITHVGKILVGS